MTKPGTIAHLFDLSGRRALISGASRGLGQAMASALAGAGAEVVLAARTKDALDDTRAAITAGGGTARCVALDVSRTDTLTGVIADIGPIDILVNNAGVEEICPSVRVTEPLWDRIIDTNLKGAFFLAQAVGAGMLARGGGSIINICSLTSYVGVPTAIPYGASKSGLLGMTRALSAEWAGAGVRVNAIAPGYFRTALTEAFYADADWAGAMLAKIPQARFGQGHDLAGAVVFLASDASAYVTGQCIAVDGGYLASI